jgi:hypothetical protein
MKTGEMNTDLEYKGYTVRLINSIKDVIKNEVSSGNDKGEAHYLSLCLDLLKRFYQMDRKWSRFHAWSYESTEEVAHIWNTIQPELSEFIQDYLKQLRHKKMTKDIKSSSAKAVIAAAMKDAGLKYRYSGQTHRAKLSVLITKDRCLTVYLAYSKLNDQLPHVIQSLKNIKHELDTLGNAFTISKAPGAGAW